MCTGFVKKGDDLLFGFNLDIDPEVWNYDLYKTNDYFTIGITIGHTLYFTHGVNKEGHFSNLPYSNDNNTTKVSNGRPRCRIDLITDRYIKNKYSYDDVIDVLKTKQIVNGPNCTLHTLLADKLGHILLIEPKYGYQEIKSDYAVISNYPLLTSVEHYEPYFGKERYEKAEEILSKSDKHFNALDGIKLLEEVSQKGKWGTKVSFVYSNNEHCVYYALNGDFSSIEKHCFNQ